MNTQTSIKAKNTEIATLIGIGKSVVKHIHEEEDMEAVDLMPLLNSLSIDGNNILVVVPCQQEGYSSESELCIESPWCDVYYDIWNYIHVEDSFSGAWCAFLLFKLKHILPLWQHAIYIRRHYLFDIECGQEMELFNNDDSFVIRTEYINKFTSPEIIKTNRKYFVTCCYWSDFQGLVRETVEVEITNGKAKLRDAQSESIIQYDCGIRF